MTFAVGFQIIWQLLSFSVWYFLIASSYLSASLRLIGLQCARIFFSRHQLFPLSLCSTLSISFSPLSISSFSRPSQLSSRLPHPAFPSFVSLDQMFAFLGNICEKCSLFLLQHFKTWLQRRSLSNFFIANNNKILLMKNSHNCGNRCQMDMKLFRLIFGYSKFVEASTIQHIQQGRVFGKLFRFWLSNINSHHTE